MHLSPRISNSAYPQLKFVIAPFSPVIPSSGNGYFAYYSIFVLRTWLFLTPALSITTSHPPTHI